MGVSVGTDDAFIQRQLLAKGDVAEAGGGRLEWANFLVMRRTHSTLMKELGVDAKLVADQLGHDVDVDINTYTLTSVELRQAAVNRLETFVAAKQCSDGAQEIGDG